MYSFSLAAVLLASLSLVSGHGQINRVTSGGASNPGPNIYFDGDSKNANTATRVMYKASSPAFVLPVGFDDNSQMSCEGSAGRGAPKTISVAAGGEIEVFWEGATGELKGKPGTGGLTSYNPWVHAMGFVIDYITSCNGDCSKFDATNAGWTKIAHAGMDMSKSISSDLRETMKNKPEQYHPTSGAGLWAMAKLVQDGSKWNIKIPSSLKSGQYLIRHELSAVHNPKNSNPTTGPQLYVACIQVDVKNGGSASLPAGTQAKNLYEKNGAFANIDVNSPSFDPSKVEIPGPPVWNGASSSSSSGSNEKPASSSQGNTGNNKAPSQGNTGNNKGSSAPNKSPVTTTAAASAPTTTPHRSCKRRRSHDNLLPRMHQNRLA